MNKTGH